MAKITKEQLVALELNEEQIKGIFTLYGPVAQEIKTLKEEKGDLESNLANIKETYLSPEQAEQLNNEKAELENKLKDVETSHADEIKQIKFETALSDKLKSAGARDTKLVKAVLDLESLEFDGENIIGLDEKLSEVTTNYDYLFTSRDEGSNKSKFSGKLNLGGTGSVTPENFSKMTATERNNLYRNDPETYKALTK